MVLEALVDFHQVVVALLLMTNRTGIMVQGCQVEDCPELECTALDLRVPELGVATVVEGM